MTDKTLVTDPQIATAQAQATAIANSGLKIVVPASTFKYLVLIDGTNNISSNPGYSNWPAPDNPYQPYFQVLKFSTAMFFSDQTYLPRLEK